VIVQFLNRRPTARASSILRENLSTRTITTGTESTKNSGLIRIN
jgi:hypothetical protein